MSSDLIFIEVLTRQLISAKKNINSLKESHKKDLEELELSKKKINDLEIQLNYDRIDLKKTISSLEYKWKKYAFNYNHSNNILSLKMPVLTSKFRQKKTSEALKQKAKNVLELSQKYMESQKSPPSNFCCSISRAKNQLSEEGKIRETGRLT